MCNFNPAKSRIPKKYGLVDFLFDHRDHKKHQEQEYSNVPGEVYRYIAEIFLVCEDCEISYLIDTYQFTND